jgi:hypothetical protein
LGVLSLVLSVFINRFLPVEKLRGRTTYGPLHMMESQKRKQFMSLWGRAFIISILSVGGCDRFQSESTERPSPLDTANKILALHGLAGKTPEARPPQVRKTIPNPETLKQLFLDYDKEDPFLANLYVGFVVGALSVNQRNLHVFQESHRAEIKAGNARISMHLLGGAWRVSLAESVPEVIKARAKMEKLKVADNTSTDSR